MALEINYFQIPIKKYEEDMETEFAKEKKNEILDLLTNFNNLRSEEEFDEIKDDLHRSCKKGDLELIKILLSERIETILKDMIFKIDKTNQTASLFKTDDHITETIIIPRTVQHESTDYLITSISGNLGEIKTVKFAEDSAVKTIYEDVFSYTKEIYFPASLKELKDGWFNSGDQISKITIPPSNDNFIFKDNKYLLGKSNENKNEFDVVHFVVSDIETISIPSNIKIISPKAFYMSSELRKIEIPRNSKLQTIGSKAFSVLDIKEIFIPPNVLKICESALSNCDSLRKVVILKNSKLQTIESNAFSFTEIREIYFPASLKELKGRWCYELKLLTKIKISPSNKKFIFKNNKYLLGKSDENKKEFDTLFFSSRSIKNVSIPSNIKIISSSAFHKCILIKDVKIPTNSNLQTIESYAFAESSIVEIFIPPNVSKICEYAFYYCKNLKKVEIPANSKLQTIGEYAFYNTNIEEIFIPPNVSKICKYAFNCYKLKKIEIPTNSNLQTIEANAFSNSKIQEIYFPANLKELKKGWCYGLRSLAKINISPSNDKFIFRDNKYLLGKSDENKDEFDSLFFLSRGIKEASDLNNSINLTKVEIPTNYNLQSIESCAFSETKIEEILIPPNVSKICKSAFKECINLRKVEIPTNSNLQSIEKYAFLETKIEEIFIPPNISKICRSTFEKCINLRKVEIPINSNLQSIEKYAFSETKIEEIFIPPNVSKICEYAFNECKNLRKVEIPTNSNLQSIEKYAFSETNIDEFFIPPNVTKICEYAFQACKNLKKVEVSENSNLLMIAEKAFSGTNIVEIFIPPNASKLCERAFYHCKSLLKSRIHIENEKSDSFIKKELSIVPNIDIPFDCSSILSFSLTNTDIIIITKDFKVIVCDDLKQKKFHTISITDNDCKVYFPISGFKCPNYDLYMVSEVGKGIITNLVKNEKFLNIGKFNPMAIFCGTLNCAAIDRKGSILYIPNSLDYLSSKLIEPIFLPNSEKAVDIACLSDFLYVLSSTGKLYMSKNADTINISFKQVNEFKRINIIQISGISKHILALTEKGRVYSKGQNLYGELGTGDTNDHFKFVEISSLNRYKIKYVSAGENHSLFLTSEGKIFACGNNGSNQCFYKSKSKDVSTVLPVETPFQKGAEFCISSIDSAAVCVGFDPEMSPNKRVKDDINIVLFGCEKKTEILQAFVNNKFTTSSNDDQNQEDYFIYVKIHEKVIKLNLIDAKQAFNYRVINEYCNQASNFLYFIDSSDQTSSFQELDQIYEIANQVWDNNIKLVLVNCILSDSSSPKLKNNEIKRKYKCEIFEVGEDKKMQNINKPFYSFLQEFYKNRNEILKVGKEYRNPFVNINKDHINIGLFGSENAKKTELSFRYIYEDLYKSFYDDFIKNFTENSLDKIVECKSNYFHVSVLDSTFVNENDDDFRSCYSAVQGIVFVFKIDLLSSSDFINEINQFYKNAKKSVGSKLNSIIALNVAESDQINDLYQSFYDKINQIESKFETRVFLFSIENGENVEDLFYCLLKKIIQNEKQTVKHKKQKKKESTNSKKKKRLKKRYHKNKY